MRALVISSLLTLAFVSILIGILVSVPPVAITPFLGGN